jgi:hypothetical protein
VAAVWRGGGLAWRRFGVAAGKEHFDFIFY